MQHANGYVMKAPASALRLEPPEVDLERSIAHRLYAARGGLESEVLDALVARPKRYTDLRPLLRGRNDNVLTKALRRLLGEGLVNQRGDPTRKPPAVTYELTSLGVAVRDAIVELRFADRIQAAAHAPSRGTRPRRSRRGPRV